MSRLAKIFTSKSRKGGSGGNPDLSVHESPKNEVLVEEAPVEDGYRQVTLLVIGAGNRGMYLSTLISRDHP